MVKMKKGRKQNSQDECKLLEENRQQIKLRRLAEKLSRNERYQRRVDQAKEADKVVHPDQAGAGVQAPGAGITGAGVQTKASNQVPPICQCRSDTDECKRHG